MAREKLDGSGPFERRDARKTTRNAQERSGKMQRTSRISPPGAHIVQRKRGLEILFAIYLMRLALWMRSKADAFFTHKCEDSERCTTSALLVD